MTKTDGRKTETAEIETNSINFFSLMCKIIYYNSNDAKWQKLARKRWKLIVMCGTVQTPTSRQTAT